MRKILFLSAALIISTFIGQRPAFAQKAGTIFQYPVKSAVIEYAYSGNTTGTSQYYIDDYGKRFAQFNLLKTKSLGSTTETNQQVIFQDSTMYTIDLIKKEGVKSKIINLDEKEITDWAKDLDSLWKSMGFKKTGEGEVLGKKCDIWEGMSTKIWVWQNFTLRSETSLFGKTIMEATRLDLGASISADKFRVPDGIMMTEQNLDAANPALDTLRNELKKSLEDFKGLFDTKKKK